MIDQDPNGKLLKFKFHSLQTLVCYEIQRIRLEILDKFVRREVGLLTELRCYLARPSSPSHQPTAEDLNALKRLFQTFERYRYPRDLRTFHTDIRIHVQVDLYLQGVRVRFEKAFEHYRFGEKLLEVQQHNFANNGLTLTSCPSIWRINFLPDQLYSRFADGDFHNLYPNIQCVYLCREKDQTISSNDYFLFIESCLALRVLKICGAGFDELFYYELSKLESVRTLTEFYLVEGCEFAESFDFDFLLNFKHLCLFGTNLATKPVMIKLIERMPPLASYDFQFIKPSDNFFCEAIIEKKNAFQLELLLGQRDPADSPDNDKATAIRVIMECKNAATHLDSGVLGTFAHWLDDLH